MKKLFIPLLLLFVSIAAFSQNGRNFIQPIGQEGFEVDSILSMRGDLIVYLRAGTEFDIEKNKVSFVEHSAIGRIDITTESDSGLQSKTQAQDSLPFPEPEFNGEAYILDLDNNTCIPMERAVGQVKTKDQFWGPEMKLYVKPASSPVRVKAGTITVILRVPNLSDDPNSFVKVSRFSVSKTRKLSLARQNELTGKITYGGKEDQELPFQYKKYGSSSLQLTFSITTPGEYCISISNPNKVDSKQSVSCFGVD